MSISCAGCGGPIVEKTLLNAIDRFWHTTCLNCSCCGLRLDELGPSVFVRSNMLLCRQDYLKLFGLSGTCAKCRVQIPPDELVMRCQDKVYHVNCFCCTHCHSPLHPGDKVCFMDGNLFCEHEFPHLFSGPPKLTSLRLASSSASPCASNDSDLGRGQMTIELPTKMNGPSPSRSFNMNSASLEQQPPPGSVPNKLIFSQSDIISSLSPHPSSPNMSFPSTMQPNQDNNQIMQHGFYVTDVEQPFGDTSIVQNTSDKPLKSSMISTGNETTNGRKKQQKKVDNRRCPALRVC
ncbi:LIM domain transcription factor LMO4-B [Schistosoma japonicum]|uniref:LIM domain transcription factor LMO4 n=1 Tax=Schistosoma japonicum TaxID=6182 RepID=B3GUX6_SCHJA|nr:LIM domain transcription factor LMO4.2 [Schistosoma japonicum]TNN09681.1 LIM domain transcription factor LMO4-B [Schistosoma japonicum]CAX70090.1 LIM domain transcription factor LMO4 [Schistosoma japonicum]CAX70091.1 LIM domain transcription factor LMO4 [Schistosoma japonicum]CAX70092.1 LIM domain transcription factor LMO4 [Schistosoma japonicum]